MTRARATFSLCSLAGLASVAASVALGSVFVPPAAILETLAGLLSGSAPSGDDVLYWSIVAELRLPRVLLAFSAGAAFSVAGAVMQSVLQNPLASPFTLGVSAGASLGSALVILFGVGTFAFMTAPIAGFIASFLTVAFLIRLSRAIDPDLDGPTIILSGMVLSLFLSAILSLLSALSQGPLNRLILWQMGSFALKGWNAAYIALAVAAVSAAAASLFHRELDILTLGDESALSVGVRAARARGLFTVLASLATGVIVSFTGVIGFVDLAVPHLGRRLVGPAHRRLIPLCAILGGTLMTLADLAARTLIPPLDLPVGAITALLGAPFFAKVFLSSRRSRP